MWVRLWMAFSVSSAVLSQHTNTRVHQSGNGFEWGWHLTPGTGAGNVGAVGQYYVKLPEAEQRVVYSADGGGYLGAAALNTSDARHTSSSSFALGQTAIDLHARQSHPSLQHISQPATPQYSNGNVPVDIFLLQQQYPTQIAPQPFNIVPSATNAFQLPNYYYKHLTPLYNIQTQHTVRNNEKSEQIESSKPLKKEANTEQTFVKPVVQVFKDLNCSDDKNHPDNVSKELESDIKKSKDLFAQVPSHEFKNINGNFGVRNRKPLTYRGHASFRVETPRPNARNERFYVTTEAPVSRPHNATEEGINRLVASTQDLITNEDLLRINNAIEYHLRDQNDDLIKPRGRFSLRNLQDNRYETLDASPTTVTVKAKIANILKGEIEHTENNPGSEQVLQSDSNDYKFSSPIVVAEAPENNYNKQIFDNVVSTVGPYIDNGYEVIGIKNSPQVNRYNNENEDSEENMINVTPRPIGTNYLAPITVALRLLNSNYTDTFNDIEDHEVADSELITDTVEKPYKEKTIVEVQESIPLSITHINDVEHHEYMDEGRSNDKVSYNFAKNLFNNYVESVRSSKKLQDNMNKILLYKFGEVNNQQENTDNNQNNKDYGESKEQLEPSENVHSQVEISPNGENNQRSEFVNYYGEDEYGSDDQKIIQPIIIEKEVPVTKFVDRYIEKQVPYPETVTVPVPVDRPVPYEVQVEKIVEKPVHITKYVDKPYPVEVPRPYPVEVKVPYPVEQKVFVDRPVHVSYPVERIVEKQIMHPVPVPTPVGVPVEVPYPVEQKVFYPYPVDRPVPIAVEVEKPVDRIVEKEVQVPVPYPVEKRVPYPVPYETKVHVPYPVEKRVAVPVEKIVEKPVTVTKYIDRPVHVQVPVPHPVPVHVHHPYPVDRIVEKRVPYPVHVDRVVEKKVNVPYPVEKIVEKIVEKPVVVTKYVNKPYPVEVKVPYAVEKIVEKKVPYAVPVEVKVPYQFEKPNNYQVAYRYGYKPNDVDETRNYPQYQLLDQNQLREKQYQHLKSQWEQYVKESQKHKTKTQPLQSTQWGNQYASSFQYINVTEPDGRQQDSKRNQAFANYMNYIKNSQNQNPHYASSQRQNQNGYNQGQSQTQNHNDNNQGSSEYNNQAQYDRQNHDQNQYNRQNHDQNEYNRQNHDQNQYNSQIQKDYYAQAQSQNHNNYWHKNRNHLEEVKHRRTDRVPKVTIEYGFKPPLIPSTEIDSDGMPVNKSE